MPYAYLTGGANGIGRAVAEMLVKNNVKVFIADREIGRAEDLVAELNQSSNVASCAFVDVADWDSQAKAFSQAVAEFGRIDYVYPIAGVGERRWILPNGEANGFQKPDLACIDIDLTGFLYTISLAVQQFRRQEVGPHGFRGKIVAVGSTSGLYCCPTLPVYTAAKHGVVGFIRSYGKYLPTEKITLNGVNPNVVRTNISTAAFYEKLDALDLLSPIEGVVEVFQTLLGKNDASGECFEVGPNYNKQGPVSRAPLEYLDAETKTLMELLYDRGLPLQLP
ncbi:glucose 1-dehydrogenase [Bisporella sp. PMI_857]|nr:glucose 1-dehydrogenase [Bisporella sp. PMI_857]